MSEYVPTTEEVRSSFASNQFVQRGEFEFELLAEDEAVVAFDAWLAAHDAEVAAKAVEDAADLAEGVECIVLDPVMEKIGKNVGLSLAQEFRARAAEYRKAVGS